mmetsp:Transcript_31678/g.66613  ORF Transcript_31678/g.66613 Transcript_31678/m.66613 type:complete len:215 (+) Transcript_31678:237-881(+)
MLAKELYMDPEKLITDDPSKGDLAANLAARLRSKANASNCRGSSCLKHAQNPNGCTRYSFASDVSLYKRNSTASSSHDMAINNIAKNTNTASISISLRIINAKIPTSDSPNKHIRAVMNTMPKTPTNCVQYAMKNIRSCLGFVGTRRMCMLLMNAIEKTTALNPPQTRFLASLGSAAAAARKLCVNKFSPDPSTVVKNNMEKFPRWKENPAKRL